MPIGTKHDIFVPSAPIKSKYSKINISKSINHCVYFNLMTRKSRSLFIIPIHDQLDAIENGRP